MERNEIETLLGKYGKTEVTKMMIDSKISFEDAVDIKVVMAESVFNNLKPDPVQIQPLIERAKKEHSFGICLKRCPWKGDYVGTGIEPTEDCYIIYIKDEEYKVDAIPITS